MSDLRTLSEELMALGAPEKLEAAAALLRRGARPLAMKLVDAVSLELTQQAIRERRKPQPQPRPKRKDDE